MKGIHIGEVLVEQGAITKEQLNEGLKLLKAGTNDRRLAEVLTDLGYITERELLDVLGRGMGLEVPKRLSWNHSPVPLVPAVVL